MVSYISYLTLSVINTWRRTLLQFSWYENNFYSYAIILIEMIQKRK